MWWCGSSCWYLKWIYRKGLYGKRWHLMDIYNNGLDISKDGNIMYLKIQVIEKSRYLL